MKILSGHHSPETAYLVEDYPYGFRLRCKIRYWTEYKRGHGTRMVSQTTNPKRGDIWNKPKASTFCRFGLAMCLNDQGHVVNGRQCTEYSSVQECVDFEKDCAHALPCDEARGLLAVWVKKKLAFNEAKARGEVVSTMTTTRFDSDGTQHPQTVEKTVLQPEKVTLMSYYKTFKRSARNFREFASARKITEETGLTYEQARERCEQFNRNLSPSQKRRGTKLEFTAL